MQLQYRNFLTKVRFDMVTGTYYAYSLEPYYICATATNKSALKAAFKRAVHLMLEAQLQYEVLN